MQVKNNDSKMVPKIFDPINQNIVILLILK
jgi:hypothetical protein